MLILGANPTHTGPHGTKVNTVLKQCALESGQQARIVHIDFRAAFDRVNHQGILYNFCFVGTGGPVLSKLTQFLPNRSQHVTVDFCGSKLVNVMSGVPQGSVLGPLLFFLYTTKLFIILEKKLICYAVDLLCHPQALELQ